MFTPFRGLAFDPVQVPSPGEATSPPYDVIGEDERTVLQSRSPFNVVRLLLAGPGDATYQEAASLLRSWRATGALRPDPDPRFYIYEMEYPAADGATRTARGVLGALDVIELGDRVVPHEETMDKHRADRLAVLEATQANIDPIIALSAAPELRDLLVPVGSPRLEFTIDGIEHRLYDLALPEGVAAISAAVAAHPVSIADGHHRYTTALGYRHHRDAVDGKGPWGAILALLVPAEGSGLTVGPYHRVFRRLAFQASILEGAFVVSPTAAAAPTTPGDLVLVRNGHAPLLLQARPDALADLPEPWRLASPAVAREVLYPLLDVDESDADYVPDAADAVAWVAGHPDGAALLTAPVSEHAIAQAGEAGLRFPQKTTFFVPKPRAGLVMRVFDPDA